MKYQHVLLVDLLLIPTFGSLYFHVCAHLYPRLLLDAGTTEFIDACIC